MIGEHQQCCLWQKKPKNISMETFVFHVLTDKLKYLQDILCKNIFYEEY